MLPTFGRPLLVVLLSLLLISRSAAQWAAHLGDKGRTGAVTNQLPGEVDRYRRCWQRTSTHPPRSSWPAPAEGSLWQKLSDITPRVVFDQAFHPVVSGGLVVWGSSSDDMVRAASVSTGQLRWTYHAGGPVRLAPHLTDDLCVFGSDDGSVHVLRLADGSVVRKKLVAPDRRLISGNGRLISTWPVRTGVVVADGIVYCTAGLFPGQGAWALAFRATTGEELWRTRLESISPQGYLLLSSDRLFIPTGRTSPVALDRKTGSLLGGEGGAGGSYAVLAGETLLSGPGNDGQLKSGSPRGAERLVFFRGSRMALTSARSFLLDSDSVACLDRPRMNALTLEKASLQQQIKLHGQKLKQSELSERTRQSLRAELGAFGERLDAIGDELLLCTLWRARIHGALSVIAIGHHVVVGCEGRVVVLNDSDGSEILEMPVNGRALGLAATGEGFLVSTDKGELTAIGLGSAQALNPERRANGSRVSSSTVKAALALSQALRPTVPPADLRGTALLVGGDSSLTKALASQTQMMIVQATPDAASADKLRRSLAHEGLAAYRIAVINQNDDLDLITSGLFNMVVVGEGVSSLARKAACRLVAPDGGILVNRRRSPSPSGFQSQPPAGGYQVHRRVPDSRAGSWTHAYANPGNTACSEDALTSGPLQLKWFGGPGPSRMVDRHLRTAPPLADRGTLVIPGNDRIIVVDSHNGTELWQKDIPGFSRTGFPYDGGYMALGEGSLFAAAGDSCLQMDLFSGQVIKEHALPSGAAEGSEWGNVMLVGDALFGTEQPAGTTRRGKTRDNVVAEYKGGQGLVTAHTLFSISTQTGTSRWSVSAPGLIASTLTILKSRVYFVRSLSQEAASGGAHPLKVLSSGGLALVAVHANTGKELWNHPLVSMPLEHSIFVAASRDRVVITGAGNKAGRNHYWFQSRDAGTGDLLYAADHPNNYSKTGGDHGEQVHHPVLIGDLLLLEPLAYNLSQRKVVNPAGGEAPWSVAYRRGCGTFSASAGSLFYRNQNPMVTHLNGTAAPTPLTRVTRPGCWINILPASGLVLLPEASAGCVCGFSLQTSLAFSPLRSDSLR